MLVVVVGVASVARSGVVDQSRGCCRLLGLVRVVSSLVAVLLLSLGMLAVLSRLAVVAVSLLRLGAAAAVGVAAGVLPLVCWLL